MERHVIFGSTMSSVFSTFPIAQHISPILIKMNLKYLSSGIMHPYFVAVMVSISYQGGAYSDLKQNYIPN